MNINSCDFSNLKLKAKKIANKEKSKNGFDKVNFLSLFSFLYQKLNIYRLQRVYIVIDHFFKITECLC